MLNVEEFEKPAVTENSLTEMAKAGVSPGNREAAENVTIRTQQQHIGVEREIIFGRRANEP
jgi:hypothetical protein